MCPASPLSRVALDWIVLLLFLWYQCPLDISSCSLWFANVLFILFIARLSLTVHALDQRHIVALQQNLTQIPSRFLVVRLRNLLHLDRLVNLIV